MASRAQTSVDSANEADSLILRDRDADLDEEEEPVLEARLWYHQNWRGDVELILKDQGNRFATTAERVKYSAFGVPYLIPPSAVATALGV